MSEKIRVPISEEIADLIDGYCQHSNEDIEAIQEALDSKKYSQIEIIAHNIIGSAGSYGLGLFEGVARKLEGAAKEFDEDGIRKCAGELKHLLTSLEIYIVK